MNFRGTYTEPSCHVGMASASSTSARNLFQDSKQRLAERVQVWKNDCVLLFKKQIFQANINSVGSLTRQIQRGSKSQEILQQTVKNFSSCEGAISSTENNLEKLQVVVAQLQNQQQTVEISCDKISQVR